MNIFMAEGGQLFRAVYYANLSRVGGQMDALLKKKMDIYQAGLESGRGGNTYKLGQELTHENIFHDANILQSFYYCDEFTEKVIIPSCENFMLDSGAFTFFSSGAKVDWEEYIQRYADFINRNHVEKFLELDIDKLIGYKNVLKLRKMLEESTGRSCIPVWHKSRGKEEYIKMCKEYPYVAIGGIVSKEIKQQEYKAFPQLIKIAHDNGAKIHGLGFTNQRELERCHFDSVDSSSWVSGNRFGSVYRFNGRRMEKYDKPDGMRLKNDKETALNNFLEWKKYCNYAKIKL